MDRLWLIGLSVIVAMVLIHGLMLRNQDGKVGDGLAHMSKRLVILEREVKEVKDDMRWFLREAEELGGRTTD